MPQHRDVVDALVAEHLRHEVRAKPPDHGRRDVVEEGPYGARRQELILIGVGMNESNLRAGLDACELRVAPTSAGSCSRGSQHDGSEARVAQAADVNLDLALLQRTRRLRARHDELHHR